MQILEEGAESWRKWLGAEAQGPRVLVDERVFGYFTYRFEMERERAGPQTGLRVLVTESKGSSKNGRSRKSFHWPTEDVEGTLRQIATGILAAAAPGAEVMDHRGGVARFFDRLTGAKHVNHVPVLVEQAGPPRHWLEATICEERAGKVVSLVERRDKRGPMWMRIPFASFERLLALLDGAQP